MRGKDLLSISDLSPEDGWRLINKAIEMKRGGVPRVLEGKVLALLFEKPSLRTRVSFEIAMHQLGGYALYLSPDEVGLGKREPVPDVAQVLGRYVDGIVARTFSHNTVELLAHYSPAPVINGLSDMEHPCQALSDLLTIQEKKGRLEGTALAFVGDGNNVAHSLLLAAALTGMDFRIASPPGYKVRDEVMQRAHDFATRSGGKILGSDDPRLAAEDAEVVYTDVWTSMGQEAEVEERRRAFANYQVDSKLLGWARKDALLMHPLPAHRGEEVAEGLLEGPQSVVFDQAENRLHLQRSLLAEVLGAA